MTEKEISPLAYAVRDRLLQLCEGQHLSVEGLADRAGLASTSSIKNIVYCKSQSPQLITIKMLCDGLGITLKDFFDAPEFEQLEKG